MFDVLKFPSPCGVNIVAKKSRYMQRASVPDFVSVPLRGKYRGEVHGAELF